MSFEEVFEKMLLLDLDNTEFCMICYDTENTIKLKCGHVFHNECLYKLKKCPYCLSKLVKNNKKENKKDLNKDNIKCKSILKSGVRKGKECGRINCGYHS